MNSVRTKINKKTYLYACPSGPGRNNKLLEACGFRYAFREVGNWNCPLCGHKLELESEKQDEEVKES